MLQVVIDRFVHQLLEVDASAVAHQLLVDVSQRGALGLAFQANQGGLQASLRQLGCYKRLSTRYSYLNPAYRRAVGADATVEAEVRTLCDELIARAGLTAELVS